MAPKTVGMWRAGEPFLLSASAFSVSFRGASEPANCTMLAMKSFTPWPDPPPV